MQKIWGGKCGFAVMHYLDTLTVRGSKPNTDGKWKKDIMDHFSERKLIKTRR